MGANDVTDFVPVADIVKAVGLRGEVKLYPLLDWYEPLLDAEVLIRNDGAAVDLESWRPQGPCYVAKLRAADDRNQAETLVGYQIGFLRSRYLESDFPRPEAGLPFRWLGREVRLVSGEVVGEVEEVRLYGAQFTLMVPREGRETLIPAIPPILVAEEGFTGPLTIDPPEGLLDVAGD